MNLSSVNYKMDIDITNIYYQESCSYQLIHFSVFNQNS